MLFSKKWTAIEEKNRRNRQFPICRDFTIQFKIFYYYNLLKHTFINFIHTN